jgi:hypothetical protein
MSKQPTQRSGYGAALGVIGPCWRATMAIMRGLAWCFVAFALGMRSWWQMFKGRPGEDPLGVVRRRKYLVFATLSLGPLVWTAVHPDKMPTTGFLVAVAVLVLSVVRVRRLSRVANVQGHGQPMSAGYVQPPMSAGHPMSAVHGHGHVPGPSQTQAEAVWGSPYTSNALAKETTDVLIEWLWYSDASQMSPRDAVKVAARMQPRTRARLLLIAEQIAASDLNEEALVWWMCFCDYLRQYVGYGFSSAGVAPSAFLADRIEGEAT